MSRHADLIGDHISSSRGMISSIFTKRNFFFTYPHSFLIFHHHRRKKLENLELILHTLRSFWINFYYFSLLKINLTYLTAIAQNLIIATSWWHSSEFRGGWRMKKEKLKNKKKMKNCFIDFFNLILWYFNLLNLCMDWRN